MIANGRRSFNLTDDKIPSRKTAFSVGFVLLCLAAWNLYRRRLVVTCGLGGAGALLCLIGLLIPVWAQRFHVIWMRFGKALGAVNMRILLSGMHYLVLTPVGFVLRLVGHDPLRLRARPAESYWIPRAETRQSRERFERLF